MLQETSRQILQVLANSVWQGAILVIIVWLGLRLLCSNHAATRHAVWLGTLAALVALPFFSGRYAGTHREPLANATLADQRHPQSRGTPTEPAVHTRELALPRQTRITPQSTTEPMRPAATSRREHSAGVSDPTSPGTFRTAPFRITGGWWTPFLLLALIGIAAVRLLRLARSINRIRQLKAECRPLPARLASRLDGLVAQCGVRRRVRVCLSDRVHIPAVLGMSRPLIVFPVGLLGRLSDSEIEQITLHELAHVRRRDDWLQLGQRAVEALLFFNPVVHFVVRQLNLEREIACDDWVLVNSRHARPYADCLSRLAELRLEPSVSLPVPGAVLTRKQIFRRIEMLLQRNRHIDPRPSLARTLALLGVMALVIAQAGFMNPVVAVTPAPAAKSEPAPPPAPDPPAPAGISAEAAIPPPPAAPAAPAPAGLSSGDRVPAPPAVPSAPAPAGVRSSRAVPQPPAPPSPERLRAQADPLDRAEDRLREAERRLRDTEERLDELGGVGYNGTMSIHHDNGERTFVWSEGSHKLRVELDGVVKFAADLTDIASISDHGYFIIEERKGRSSRELEVLPGRDGGLDYFYFEGRNAREFDADARAWMADVLGEMVRRTGIGADSRVEAILSDAGPDGVLREIGNIESDYVKRVYFEELIKQGDLDAPAVRKTLRQMGHDLDSDYEKAELLIQLAGYAGDSPEEVDAYIEAVSSLDSDYETRRVLEAWGTGHDISEAYADAVLGLATTMSSDYERAELLIRLADFSRDRGESRDLYLKAVGDIGSDYEKRRVLEELLMPRDVTEDFVEAVLRQSQTIGSDYERAELLRRMAEHAAGSDRLMSLYLDAARDIGSDYEQRRVLSKLALRKDVSDNVLRDLLEVAADIDSDYEKAEFLLEYGDLFVDRPGLERDLDRVIDSFDSEYEQDRVLSRLYRLERKSRSERD